MESDFLKSDVGRSVQDFLQTFSHEDDFSDLSLYYQRKAPTAVTEYTLVDVSDGPKTVVCGMVVGQVLYATDGTADRIGPVTVDGTANTYHPGNKAFNAQDANGAWYNLLRLLPVRYDSSYKVEWEHEGDGDTSTAYVFILGSGPHSVAVVKDGEPVYMTAENLSERTIEEMSVPSGYRIVRDPEITHEDPQTKGMWDDDEERIVDHPYWKPFHETLDKLGSMAMRSSVEGIIGRIEKNPTAYDGVFQGELPQEDPVEEAIQFWYEREKERGTDLSQLKKIRGS